MQQPTGDGQHQLNTAGQPQTLRIRRQEQPRGDRGLAASDMSDALFSHSHPTGSILSGRPSRGRLWTTAYVQWRATLITKIPALLNWLLTSY
ncbi:hypothetical protein JQ580_23635 [Bradyrhizobium japonicum]|uniref:hypothetical protein n=1 Tax=Bradyrhizobium japonicum TaxID=375 RepID=UPI001BA917F7|nr:hypothetical protein [Bradyrhizobium japonicum]MBR0993720.1 hypothetical protein [Bradyrhizobium japonicum]